MEWMRTGWDDFSMKNFHENGWERIMLVYLIQRWTVKLA